MVRLGLGLAKALIAGILFTKISAINTVSSSGFVASDGSVLFALNIPQDADDNDLYFSLSGPTSSSWISVGMGNDKMDGTLMFLLYQDSTGKNVTLSPRLAKDHVEPTYTKDIEITLLPGTGVSNGNMTANAMCKNCRSWGNKYAISGNDTKAKFIFGYGLGSLKSNSLSAGLRRHSSYGSFTMDLTKAVGAAGVPVAIADTSGTVQDSIKTDHDFAPALHACVMILAFVGLMPLGIMILRIMDSPKWHGWNQALSAVVALIGAMLGIYIGTMYNRTKSYNSAHQIFGILIIVAMIAQFVLGFMHHRIYKKTLATTKLAPIHVWLGRVLIPCGIANGFLGFPLALNSKYNWALLALVLLVVIVTGPFAFWKYKRNVAKKNVALNGGNGLDTGYQSQPWTTAPSRSDINLNNYPPPYQAPVENRQFL